MPSDATPDTARLQQQVDRLNAQVDALDREIARLREQKAVLAGERRAVLAELELQTKLRTLTPEHRRRVTVTAVAHGAGRAVQ